MDIIQKIINEEVNRLLLREYMAVWRDDAITELAKQIANDFAPLNMRTRINKDKEFKAEYSLYLGNNQIPITVLYKIGGSGWRGVYRSNEKSITLRLWGNITADNVLSGLYHEITHALDANLENQLNKKIGYNYGEDYITLQGVRSTTCDKVNNILYRLWTFTERNAYQSHSLFGIKFCQNYINGLREDIDYLKTHTNKNEDVIYGELRNRLARKRNDSREYIGNKRLFRSNWKAFKRYFIKKSYVLLEKFSKKLIKNAYKAQEEGLVVQLTPNENSNIFKDFKRENDAVELRRQKQIEKQEELRQARIKKAAIFVKEFSKTEDERLERTFNEIVENLCKEKYGEKACCQTKPDEDVIRHRSLIYLDRCYFYDPDSTDIKFNINTSIHGYNPNYFLVFGDGRNTQYGIEDVGLSKEICIFSTEFNRIVTNIISNSVTYSLNGPYYDIWFDKKRMFNELNRRKDEIISTLKNSLHELYSSIIKKEFTLTLKLKDREVNLSAPSREELAVKLRNEFPKWSDSVINNWVSKATED